MAKNIAAWLRGQNQYLQIEPAPYRSPKSNEIVIKNRAVAINPIDWMLQEQGIRLMYPWLKYPFILGLDVAGEIVEIGSDVSNFSIGDRVLGYAVGTDKSRNDTAEGGFQLYTVLLAHLTTVIPEHLSFEQASVLPLGLSTAACGLFQDDQLGLELPSAFPKARDKTVIIWGGSTSVGSNAIQLAVAAGYDVVTTASPRNFDYVKSLGASHAFDYNSKTVVQDMISGLKGKTVAGALSIGAGAADACMDILDKCEGNKFISMATYPMPDPKPRRFVLLTTMYTYVSWNISAWVRAKLRGIQYKFIFGTTLIDNGVGKAIFVDFLPNALAKDTYKAVPEPMLAGKGLEEIQKGLDIQRKGVSAQKVVISL